MMINFIIQEEDWGHAKGGSNTGGFFFLKYSRQEILLSTYKSGLCFSYHDTTDFIVYILYNETDGNQYVQNKINK
jgi:hypothetical protein